MAMQEREKQIKFDPTDWKGMLELCHRYQEFDTYLEGKNSNGEDTMLSINKDNIVLDTFQSNGWIRQNIYYPQDCTVEERYIR